jgi:hypothetical protein
MFGLAIFYLEKLLIAKRFISSGRRRPQSSSCRKVQGKTNSARLKSQNPHDFLKAAITLN